jgi:hypothetical protein
LSAEKDIGKARRMGRPALGLIATVVRLAPDMLARIDALHGPGRRAIFIRDAIAEKLEREGK